MNNPRDMLEALGRESQGELERITPDHELMAPPSGPEPSLVDPEPRLLSTQELEWPDFERLIYRMAREDGATNAYLYGHRGQAQHGIDIIDLPGTGHPTVYQAKRQQSFSESDLEEAVDRYAEGRHLNAQRIVVAVACEAHSRQVLDKLKELQDDHAGLQIELWDRLAISERLRGSPDVVRMFFGAGTAERFCGVTEARTDHSQSLVLADAVLRGPIAHLGLSEALGQATAAIDKDPLAAAGDFATVARKLEDSPFVAYASRVRRQQAQALGTAGDLAASSLIRLDLGWHLLVGGDPFSARNEVREIAECSTEIPEEIMRAAEALSVAIGVRYEADVTVDELAEAFDALLTEDPHRGDAAVVLAEEAVAARRPGLASMRADALEAIAAVQRSDDAGQSIAARLRMCIADCGGDWDALATGATRYYAPPLAAWVLARHARHLALALRPDESEVRWYEAIERACNAGKYDDAADWLYAVRALRVKFDRVDGTIDDCHRSALALRAMGGGTILPEPYSAKERALSALREEKWTDALEALRRFAWRSTVIASLADELEAHRLLGELFAATRRPTEAARHMIVAGDLDGLKRLAASAPDEPLKMDADSLPQTPWERAAAFTYVSAAADLLVDDDAKQWTSLALREVLAARGRPATGFSDDVPGAAFEAFGRLAGMASREAATSFLDLAQVLAASESGVHPVTGEAYVRSLIGIARSQPSLRREAAVLLCAELVVDPRVRGLVLGAEDVLRDERAAAEQRLTAPASQRNVSAALGLVVAEADIAAVVPMARRCVERFANPRERTPGHHHVGTGASDVSLLITTLEESERAQFARCMLRDASDRDEITVNRNEYLLALVPLAKTLDDELRSDVFAAAMAYAQGEHDGEEPDDPFSGPVDPLSRFRLRFGPDSLAPTGLQVAAAAARTPNEYAAVQTTAVAMLPDADDRACHGIAWALTSVPHDQLSVDLARLAEHKSAWMRAFAATAWCKRKNANRALGELLVRDPSGFVRRSLATGLRDLPIHDELRMVLSTDPRRSVRQAAIT